jgi:hypothetical protein
MSNSHFSDGLHRLIVLCVTIFFVSLVALLCWAGVRATEADRETRSRQADACKSIEIEIARSECIRTVG